MGGSGWEWSGLGAALRRPPPQMVGLPLVERSQPVWIRGHTEETGRVDTHAAWQAGPRAAWGGPLAHQCWREQLWVGLGVKGTEVETPGLWKPLAQVKVSLEPGGRLSLISGPRELCVVSASPVPQAGDPLQVGGAVSSKECPSCKSHGTLGL